jgi:uncharacterized membrane protein (DUF373 family)
MSEGDDDRRGDPDAGSGGEPDTGTDERLPTEHAQSDAIERAGQVTDSFINVVEIVAAGVFAVLFAIGVVDLILQIGQAVARGDITDPLVVIGFIDTGLLLLIIVEVYQTVIAYTRESDTRVIVRLVIYTGVIAMVRKVIVFRTSEYSSEMNAALVALSYTIIIAGLVGLLLAERRYGGALENRSATGE